VTAAVEIVVSASALLVAGAVGETCRRGLGYLQDIAEEAEKAHDRAEKALRLLRGEDEQDDGLVDVVEENREALLYADAYPPEPHTVPTARGEKCD
jgi:hypothetical protein